MRKKSSNKALKSLFIMCFFLISASFLAPDVLDIWASTQKNDFRRELARDWSESIGDNIYDYDEVFEELAEKYGDRFLPPQLLLDMEVKGEAFN